MALKANQTFDFEEHKRKIFFEHLSPKTTRDSLREYLSGFEIEVCVVPVEDGKSKGYGFVIFRKESSVNTVMSKRPHIIDGQHVELYRSVPGQGTLKEKKGIKELIVSGFKTGLITKSDLEKYFCGFGTIIDINLNHNDDSYSIEFDDYDPVDKVLLDRPHIIKNIEVQLTKGSRKGRFGNITPPKNTQATSNNNTSPITKKSNLKQVQIDPEIATVNMPNKIYCIHIRNLPSNVHAETLSIKFNYPMGKILMGSSTDNESSSTECWLKGFTELQEARNFERDWDGQVISGSKIDCDVEEDMLEFCYKFRIGECPKTNEVCDWEHIMCSANGKCSNDCPLGHREGMKTGFRSDPRSNDTYRVKITGFQKKLTPEILSQMLNEKKCFVSRSQDFVGYIGPLRTMKYSRRLMEKWHNKVVDGQKLRCQIEWNQRYSMSKAASRSASVSNLATNENDSRRFGHIRQETNSSRNSSRDTSPSRDDSEAGMTVLDDIVFNYEARLYDKSVEGILKQKDADIKRKTKSTENLPLSAHQKGLALSFTEISEGDRKMSVVRKKTDHGSFAFLVEYKKANEEVCRKELNALQLLKGVRGVIQWINPKELSDNDDQLSASKNDLSLLAEYTPGCTLRKFVNQIHRSGFGVLQAVELVQNLITIVKQVHTKNVLHQNLGPDSILIEWDSKQKPVDQAELVLINFSHAYIKSEKNTQINKSISDCWYKAPQANVESFKYSSTIDASSICGILLWLLTNTDPRHDQGKLPHQQDNVTDKLDNKIGQAVRNANDIHKLPLDESQLKRYLIDTFNIGFGYPEYQPWTITDLECRLESIRELLSPRNPKLTTTDAIFKAFAFASARSTSSPATSTTTNVHQDIFEKAAIAFRGAKTKFSNSNDQYSWSDGGCTWLNSTQIAMNERRHDDILTFDYREGRMSGRCSIIITCLATLTDQETCITLSISSAVNGKISRIPIGRYSKTQNFTMDVQKNFSIELDNLIKSLAKE